MILKNDNYARRLIMRSCLLFCSLKTIGHAIQVYESVMFLGWAMTEVQAQGVHRSFSLILNTTDHPGNDTIFLGLKQHVRECGLNFYQYPIRNFFVSEDSI